LHRVETAPDSAAKSDPASRGNCPSGQTTRTGDRAGNEAHGGCHYSTQELEGGAFERIRSGPTTGREGRLERAGAGCRTGIAAGAAEVLQSQGQLLVFPRNDGRKLRLQGERAARQQSGAVGTTERATCISAS